MTPLTWANGRHAMVFLYFCVLSPSNSLSPHYTYRDRFCLLHWNFSWFSPLFMGVASLTTSTSTIPELTPPHGWHFYHFLFYVADRRCVGRIPFWATSPFIAWDGSARHYLCGHSRFLPDFGHLVNLCGTCVPYLATFTVVLVGPWTAAPASAITFYTWT